MRYCPYLNLQLLHNHNNNCQNFIYYYKVNVVFTLLCCACNYTRRDLLLPSVHRVTAIRVTLTGLSSL